MAKQVVVSVNGVSASVSLKKFVAVEVVSYAVVLAAGVVAGVFFGQPVVGAVAGALAVAGIEVAEYAVVKSKKVQVSIQ